MLPKKHRLSKSAEVKKTTARGRSFFNPFFVIKHIAGETARSTVIVSTKVSKKAVDRNRIKRVLREELRSLADKLKPGDYAILVKSSAQKIESANLRAELAKALKQSRNLK